MDFKSGDPHQGGWVEASCKEPRARWEVGSLGCPGVHFCLIDVELEEMLIFFFFFFFFWSTGDREQSGLLCNQRLCPADNTRGINCPCPSPAPEEGAEAASQCLGLSNHPSPPPPPAESLAQLQREESGARSRLRLHRATEGESLAWSQRGCLVSVRRGLPGGILDPGISIFFDLLMSCELKTNLNWREAFWRRGW